MSAMNKKPIGTRWIDIVPSTAGEIRAARSCGGLVPVGQSAKDVERYAGADFEYSSFQFGECWVKLRGLPFSITKKDVADFLLRASVIPVGIFLSEGIGYVELQSMSHVDAVLLLHKQKIAHRWVEVFHLSRAEAMQKVPPQMQMQMQMQMQQGYGAMHMQQAAGSYASYPYAVASSAWYTAAASGFLRFFAYKRFFCISVSERDAAFIRRFTRHRGQNARAAVHVSGRRSPVRAVLL